MGRDLKELRAVLAKELLQDRRQQFVWQGLLAYVLCLVVLAGLGLRQPVDANTWLVVFWLLQVFVAITAVAKGFATESPDQLRYLYQWVAPENLLLGKMLYAALWQSLLGTCSVVAYSLLLGNPVAHWGAFLAGLAVASVGLGATLTLVSAIAAQTGNRSTLMTVLSFPIVLPVVLLGIRQGQGALLGVARWNDLGLMGALCLGLAGVAWVLYPYLWRD